MKHWFLARRAARHAALPPDRRRLVEERDRFLRSRRSLGLWAGLVCAIAGTTAGLSMSPDGTTPGIAFALSLGLFAGLFRVGMTAWVQPETFSGRKLWRLFGMVLVATYAGALASFSRDWSALGFWQVVWRATPLQFIAFTAALILLAALASTRQQWLQRELARARAEQERDASARLAAQARLGLLQAQIQPHFLFNTLAALQHWVDTADTRAGPLLSALTRFLRGATEHMGEPQVTLERECAVVRDYLEVMQARLGDRLAGGVALAPEAAALPVPPGLVVTLVENAVEHGIAPALRGGTVRVDVRRIVTPGQADRCRIEVTDDGVGLHPAAVDGIGLANSRERLRHAFGPEATLALAARDPESGGGAVARAEWRLEIGQTAGFAAAPPCPPP